MTARRAARRGRAAGGDDAADGGGGGGGAVGLVRGRHYTEWLPELEDLLAREEADADAEGLRLLAAVLDAVEEEAAATGIAPPPAWYLRAAALYRRRGEIAAEVEVLRRYAEWAPLAAGEPIDARLLTAEAELADPGADEFR